MDLERIKRLHQLYSDAEQRIKVVEFRAMAKLPIGCVNELRYAGHHVLNYLLENKESEWDEATVHCSRALYDACELEALYYLTSFKAFKLQFKDMAIAEVIAPYLTWQQVHTDTMEFVAKHTRTDGRGRFYQELLPYIEKLYEVQKLLPAARESLLKKQQQQDNLQLELETVKRQLSDERSRTDEHMRHTKRLHIVALTIGLVVAALAWAFPAAPSVIWKWLAP